MFSKTKTMGDDDYEVLDTANQKTANKREALSHQPGKLSIFDILMILVRNDKLQAQ